MAVAVAVAASVPVRPIAGQNRGLPLVAGQGAIAQPDKRSGVDALDQQTSLAVVRTGILPHLITCLGPRIAARCCLTVGSLQIPNVSVVRRAR
jgi:hypothetical protein